MRSARSVLVELLRARYGDAAPRIPPYAANGNDVLANLFAHRSVRAFGSERLPTGTLELLIAAAQSAPSSANLHAWSVVAVENPARKARLARLCDDQVSILEAPVFLVWLADLARLRRLAESYGTASEALNYLDSFVRALIDVSLAAQNAATAAESLGLGTCFVGALRNHPDRVAEELCLPPEVFPVFGLVVGYPDHERPPGEVKPRLPVNAVLHREAYGISRESEAWRGYDAIFSAFQASQHEAPTGWTSLAAKRVQDGAALGSRAGLSEAVSKLGFKLS
ncbi:MAG TPA: nitroreductase family protein [Polyangiaceae bacterium]|nr:nitroreductase family protein [Polyangiaceae bacterium]